MALLLVAGASTLGCGTSEPTTLDAPLTLHELPTCPLPPRLLDENLVELEAFGDFDVTPQTSVALSPRDLGVTLTFPVETRRVEARIGSGSSGFRGIAAARFGAPSDILLWPEGDFCRLSQASAPYPAPGSGQALGVSARRGLVLAAGGDAGQSAAVVGAVSFALGTGESVTVDATERHVLLEPRAFATATEFGDKLLVAGGENPLSTRPIEERPAFDSAEIFDPDEQRFELDLIELRTARTRHAALVLPGGATLLVGGRGADGEALALLEAVDPLLGVSSLGGLTALEHGRIEPQAFVNERGEIVVAGGYDASGEPVPSIEWLTPDAREHARPSESVPARLGQAYAPLPGAVLAVGGCVPGATVKATPPCRRGVPPERWEGFWLPVGGTPEVLTLDFPAPAPVLASGEGGAPWLLASGAEEIADEATGRPLLFNPWTARFEPPSALLSTPFVGVATRAIAVDPGLFLVLSETPSGAALFGLRHGTRQEFSRDVALILSTDPIDAERPLHLSPDRLPGDATVRYTGTLELVDGTVFLADATFLDFEATLQVAEGEPPRVILAGPDIGYGVFGEGTCAWPGSQPKPPYTLRVTRTGTELTLAQGRYTERCNSKAGRATLGLGSVPGARISLARWDVRRLAGAG